MRVLLLHGWGGSDFPHWQSWLACELAKNYGCVDFLRLPSFDTPKLSQWLAYVSAHIKKTSPEIVVCHSLGNILWFHLCNAGLLEGRCEELYLVAPPSLSCDIVELQSFFPVQLPSDMYAKNIHLIVSDNDPYMHLSEAEKLAQKLGVKMHLLKNAGHINAQSGFGKWPWILKSVTKKLGM